MSDQRRPAAGGSRGRGLFPRRRAAVAAHLPWRALTWRQTAFAACGIALHLPVFMLAALPWLLFVEAPAGALYVPEELTKVLFTVAGPLLVLLYCAGTLSAAQRCRFRWILGIDIPRSDRGAGPDTTRYRPRAIPPETAWRQVAYHLGAGSLLLACEMALVALWGAGALLLASFAWIGSLPGTARMSSPALQWAVLTGLGVACVMAAPWGADLIARVDTGCATRLFGPSRAAQLTRRVESLTEGRADLVAAVDAERRRLERDLHDGAQQQLVSLAMNLGLARATMPDLPPDAVRVIDAAREGALTAIGELKDLVRGLHPAILDDRGLDAALSALATRAPFPVTVSVETQARPSPAAEAVAYFVVSEALTNVARHARATCAGISVRHAEGMLRVVVTDDGVGGADPGHGSGLAGLGRRAASVDGSLHIDSPPGGPTRLALEVPCE